MTLSFAKGQIFTADLQIRLKCLKEMRHLFNQGKHGNQSIEPPPRKRVFWTHGVTLVSDFFHVQFSPYFDRLAGQAGTSFPYKYPFYHSVTYIIHFLFFSPHIPPFQGKKIPHIRKSLSQSVPIIISPIESMHYKPGQA